MTAKTIYEKYGRFNIPIVFRDSVERQWIILYMFKESFFNLTDNYANKLSEDLSSDINAKKKYLKSPTETKLYKALYK